jgi:hypothetical protein
MAKFLLINEKDNTEANKNMKILYRYLEKKEPEAQQ